MVIVGRSGFPFFFNAFRTWRWRDDSSDGKIPFRFPLSVDFVPPPLPNFQWSLHISSLSPAKHSPQIRGNGITVSVWKDTAGFPKSFAVAADINGDSTRCTLNRLVGAPTLKVAPADVATGGCWAGGETKTGWGSSRGEGLASVDSVPRNCITERMAGTTEMDWFLRQRVKVSFSVWLICRMETAFNVVSGAIWKFGVLISEQTIYTER